MPVSVSVEDGIFTVRAVGVIKMADMVTFMAEYERYYGRPDCPGLALSDVSQLKVIAPEATDTLVLRLKGDNPKLMRSAFILGEGVAALQMGRILHLVPSPKRRIFSNVDEARAWLLGTSPY